MPKSITYKQIAAEVAVSTPPDAKTDASATTAAREELLNRQRLAAGEAGGGA